MDSQVLVQLIASITAIIVAVIGMRGVIRSAVITSRGASNRPTPDAEQSEGRTAPPDEGRSWTGRVRRIPRPHWPGWPGWTPKAITVVMVVALAATGTWGLVDALGETCTERTPVTIMVSAEKDLLLKDLADEYDGTGRTCSDISVTELTSGKALDELLSKTSGQKPHVWMPSSSMWVDLLRSRPQAAVRPIGDVKSVARSPLVIAMPDKVAKAFGWNQRKFGWQEVLGYARDPNSWDRIRERNPGLTQRFFLAKENPETSTSAFAATVASYYAAATRHGKSGELTSDDVNDKRITNDVRNIESSLKYRNDDIMDLLNFLGSEDDEGRASSYLSGLVMQEVLSYQYNSGDPEVFEERRTSPRKEPLRVFYPKDGTIMMDHPYALLSTLNPAQKKVARDFREYLRDSERQDRFRQNGFRGHDGKMFSTEVAQQAGLPKELTGTPLLEKPKPDTKALQAIHSNIGSLRQSARVLLLVDRSGSMGQRPPGTFKSGLEIVKEQLHDKMIDQLGDNDELAIWSFAETHQENLPPTPGKLLKSGKGRQEFQKRIADIASGGNTALHGTVLAAVRALRAESSTPDRLTPTIIVLSDGYDTQDALSLAQLRQRMTAEGEETPVPRIYTIGYGITNPDKDRRANALKDISIATKGNFYDAKKDAVDLDRVFVDVFGHL
jgi:Ca-activated chloride channel family protein